MRIAMVCADGLPAGGRARREARALAQAGHRVTIHGVLGEKTEAEEDEGDVVLVRAPLRRFTRPRDGFVGALAAGGYFERCRPIVDLAMRRDPPEVLHAFGLDVALPAAQAARAAKIPFVLDEGPDATDEDSTAAAPARDGARLREALSGLRVRAASVERTVRTRATASLVSSEPLADDVHHRFGGDRPVVLRDVPPLRRVTRTDALRERADLRPSDRVVVFHGPADEAHGAGVAISALRVLGEKVKLVVLGAAWCQDRLLGLASDAGVLSQVRVVSPKQGDDVLRLLASAEVAVLPFSGSDRATRLGLRPALFDALMAGLPVVVSDVAGAGGLVRRVGAGLVLPSSAPPLARDVAGALRTLLADPDARASHAAAARRAARTDLHWEKESERLVDLYDRISSSI